jgi:pimeloyl-ACP methyl ester carboxylesterase
LVAEVCSLPREPAQAGWRGDDTPADGSKLAEVNGIRLGYRDLGEGEPLVLLHGGFGTVEMFGPNLELLAAGRRVIGVDLQSHGRSPAADRPMRFEAMGDDIAALVS